MSFNSHLPKFTISIPTFFFIFIVFQLLSCRANLNMFEKEYRVLYDATEDKEALEAIRDLHQQLDDDNDGTIEPSETGDFIKGDLQYNSDKQRQTNFHLKDEAITVGELWNIWHKSEVYKWTVDNVVDWLIHNELGFYQERFRRLNVNGTQLPKVAVSSSYLSKVLGITNPIHRSKLHLKAMDIVLFGPPRDQTNFLKDMVLTTLLVIAVTGLFYAFRQNSKSQNHLKRMMQDMDSLSKAEQALMELQEKLQQKDSKIESLSTTLPDWSDCEEIGKLREELEILRNELHRAEIELEDKCWVAPPVLQHWLQMTYELENSIYNAKRKAAEAQMEMAKEMCERLKKKRSSLVGAFVSTHGGSIDDVDRSILDARTALMELTKDLTERSQRWRQIEMLCGCSITQNPGLNVLQNLVKHIGGSRRGVLQSGNINLSSSRMSNSVSQEDLLQNESDNSDANSIASSHHTSSSRPMPSFSLLSTTLKDQHKRKSDLKPLSRRSSSDTSSSSDEIIMSIGQSPRHPISTPPLIIKRSAADKRKEMVKSYSQDDPSDPVQEQIAPRHISTSPFRLSPMVNRAILIGSPGLNSLTSSVSESHLSKHQVSKHQPNSFTDNEILYLSKSKPSLASSELSASDSGSMNSLNEKKKKKRMFFNFGKKIRDNQKDVM